MNVGSIYENIMMPGVYIRVDTLIKRTLAGHTYLVSWFRRDDITKKLVDMDVQQEMFIPAEETKYYKKISN